MLEFLFEGGERQLLVVLGDGGTIDESVVRHVLPRLDGRSVSAVLPRPPLAPAKKTGPSALGSVLRLADKGLDVRAVLFLVDREHESGIEPWLVEHGFRITGRRELAAGAIVYDVVRGPKKLRLYVALAGRSKSIEEDLAELVRLVLGRSVDPRKVKSRRRLVGEALRRASREQLKAAFPYLAALVEEVERGFSGDV